MFLWNRVNKKTPPGIIFLGYAQAVDNIERQHNVTVRGLNSLNAARGLWEWGYILKVHIFLSKLLQACNIQADGKNTIKVQHMLVLDNHQCNWSEPKPRIGPKKVYIMTKHLFYDC